MVGHPPAQGPLYLGAQGKLTQVFALLGSGLIPLLLETFVLEAVEAGGPFFDLLEARIGGFGVGVVVGCGVMVSGGGGGVSGAGGERVGGDEGGVSGVSFGGAFGGDLGRENCG